VVIEVLKEDLRRTRVVDAAPDGRLGEGEVELAVESFGLSANNVTYAAFGEAMSYWRFFPASDDRWGCVPVWGFGDVLESNAPGVETGERFYGYFPMAHKTRMRVEPHGGGIVAVDDHRRELPAVYNQYLRTPPDAPHHDETLLLRPLFATSFLIEAFLAGRRYFDAEAVVLSSASSKTAYGLAFMLARAAGAPEVIGLTSARNRAFVEQLGLYDRVLTYHEIEFDHDALVYVDMAGDAAVREAVHRSAGERLRHSAVVGATHWDEPAASGEPLPGPKPEFFFAPTHLERLQAQLGAKEVQRRMGEAWDEFVGQAGGWMDIESGEGPDEVERVWHTLVEGTVDPRSGHVLTLR
jgi:hypothetical protein